MLRCRTCFKLFGLDSNHRFTEKTFLSSWHLCFFQSLHHHWLSFKLRSRQPLKAIAICIISYSKRFLQLLLHSAFSSCSSPIFCIKKWAGESIKQGEPIRNFEVVLTFTAFISLAYLLKYQIFISFLKLGCFIFTAYSIQCLTLLFKTDDPAFFVTALIIPSGISILVLGVLGV